MNEKKKISFGTLICMIIVVILLGLVIGLVYYNQKESENSKQSISKLEEQIADLQTTIKNMSKDEINDVTEIDLNKNKEIDLTDAKKVAINAGLNDSENSLNYALRYILNEINGTTNIGLSKIEYNTNLLQKEPNKYYIVWTIMNGENIKFTKGEATGERLIELDTIKKYYNKVLGTDMNEQALLSVNMPYSISIKDGIFYGSIVTGWGSNPIALKAKSLTLDETTKTYTLLTDFLYTDNGSIDEQENNFAGKDDTLKYSDSLVKVQLEIEYQEKENGDKVLTSLVFKK